MHNNYCQHVVELKERPQTTHCVEDLLVAEGRVPSNCFSVIATAEPLTRVQEFVKHCQEPELKEAQGLQKQQAMNATLPIVIPFIAQSSSLQPIWSS